MSLDALALRVLLPSFPGPSLPDDWARLLEEGLGGICLFGSNLSGEPDAARDLTDAVRAVRPEALVAVDEEGGDVTRLHAGSGSPVLGAAQLGAVDDLATTAYAARAVAADLVAAGIDLDLGPVADVNSNPDNPVIGTRSFGTDPDAVGRHVGAWIIALQGTGVAACAKHFPGHGATGQDSHLTLPTLDVTREELGARELVPFRAAVDAGVAAVMTSHIVVPSVDAGQPATMSAPLLAMLRDELGFTGAIVSDALDMAGASSEHGIPEAAVLSLVAGADLLCIGPDKDEALVRAIQEAVVAAVREGRLAEERLVEAAARVAGIRRAPTKQAADPDATDLDASAVDAAMLEAARRALSVEGPLPRLEGARLVRIETPANIAVGEVPWGIASEVVVLADEALPGGPVVVQLRDGHRHPQVLAMLDRLTSPAVVVEWGWPGPADRLLAAGHARVCTRGSSRPMIRAVEELLSEAGWRG